MAASELADEGIPRVAGGGLTREQFACRHEDASSPCILTGLLEAWPAWRERRWRPGSLAARFPDAQWDVGRESGETVTLPDYLQQWTGSSNGTHLAGSGIDATSAGGAPAANSTGAAPAHRGGAYIFDATYGEAHPELLAEYSVPPVFPRFDYLAHLSSLPQLRPRYRWLLIGGPGTGFTIHVDPHATCAWNALLVGRKRWVLLPPDTPLGLVLPSQAARAAPGGESMGGADGGGSAGPATVAGDTSDNDGHSDSDSECDAALPPSESSAAAWFDCVYPSLRARAAREYGLGDGGPGPGAARPLRVLEGVQAPGEVIFVPAGWWHVALNLPPEAGAAGGASAVSVAVTHNYMGARDFGEAIQRLVAAGAAPVARAWCERAAAAGLPAADELLRGMQEPALHASTKQESAE
jgi:histone arginine demethylase JMJD6